MNKSALPEIMVMADYGASGIWRDGVCEAPEDLGLNHELAQRIRNWNHVFNLSSPTDQTDWWERKFGYWFAVEGVAIHHLVRRDLGDRFEVGLAL